MATGSYSILSKANIMILLFLLFQVVYSKNCDECTCPNITTLYYGESTDLFYSETTDCISNVTCQSTHNTWVASTWNVTDIQTTENVDISDYLTFRSQIGFEPGPYVDLFELFGMECDNGKWVVTKYPFGVDYQSVSGRFYYINSTELEGKGYKSEINYIACWTNPKGK